MPPFSAALAREPIARTWHSDIVPALTRYIEIPNKSPLFDPEWQSRGHMSRAVDLVATWCRARAVPGLALEVVQLPGRTPLLWMEAPGEIAGTILLYGHLDKQPELSGWAEGLGPWTPVLRGDRLYGRGGADDGYAAFASLAALEALAAARVSRKRCVVLIEAGEESGSPDLPAYVEHLATRIGEPELVICLDSGCGNYEQLWCTTSLRGLVNCTLHVEILDVGVHSGDASGVVPSSFRILRQLLSRIEDEGSGAVRVSALHAEVPADRRAQTARAAEVLGSELWKRFPFIDGARPMGSDPVEMILNRTWRSTLSITGIDGVPSLRDGGNVLRASTSAKLSVRIPPTLDATLACDQLRSVLTANPPYGARVRFEAPEAPGSGWNAPALAPWLEQSLGRASHDWFGKPAVFMGEGGSIPFMAMLGARYPRAQFVITGVLGPGANAHGPNEFLHLPTAQRLTGCVAQVIADASAPSAA